MAIEQTINRSAKTVGGMVGFSRNVNAHHRWCLTRHKKKQNFWRRSENRDDYSFMSTQSAVHSSTHRANRKRFERDVQQMTVAFTNFINPFETDNS